MTCEPESDAPTVALQYRNRQRHSLGGLRRNVQCLSSRICNSQSIRILDVGCFDLYRLRPLIGRKGRKYEYDIHKPRSKATSPS